MEQNEVQVKIEDMDAFQNFIYSGDMYLLYAVLIFMAIDVITGWAKALKNGNLWSTKSVYGTGRKLLALFVVIIANIIDNILGLNGIVIIAIMYYYIATEGLSILENLAEMNVPFPEQIKDKLEVLKDKGSEK
ncbi:MAG: phage holin family protein [Staphylococcus equorum]|nr:phage holin family protein [Staphylococcus equorum]